MILGFWPRLPRISAMKNKMALSGLHHRPDDYSGRLREAFGARPAQSLPLVGKMTP
jgi:hypothetical protein